MPEPFVGTQYPLGPRPQGLLARDASHPGETQTLLTVERLGAASMGL